MHNLNASILFWLCAGLVYEGSISCWIFFAIKKAKKELLIEKQTTRDFCLRKILGAKPYRKCTYFIRFKREFRFFREDIIFLLKRLGGAEELYDVHKLIFEEFVKYGDLHQHEAQEIFYFYDSFLNKDDRNRLIDFLSMNKIPETV